MKQEINKFCISGLCLWAKRKGVRPARKRLAKGCRYTLSKISAGVKSYSLRKSRQMSSGSWCFRKSPTRRFPNTAPLPSSPKIYPNGEILAVIFPRHKNKSWIRFLKYMQSLPFYHIGRGRHLTSHFRQGYLLWGSSAPKLFSLYSFFGNTSCTIEINSCKFSGVSQLGS